MPRSKIPHSKIPRSKTLRKPKSRKTKPTPTYTPSTSPDAPIFFWKVHEIPYGVFSQWYIRDFPAPTPTGVTTFGTAEQYMMYQKALLFDDTSIASEILTTTDPRTQKALGRAVKGFDEETWCAQRCRIVAEGNYWKFMEDEEGRRVLLGTGEREIVEASPRDRVWGVGFGEARAGKERGRWGLNLLGKALEEVRERIRGEGVVGGGERVEGGEAMEVEVEVEDKGKDGVDIGDAEDTAPVLRRSRRIKGAKGREMAE